MLLPEESRGRKEEPNEFKPTFLTKFRKKKRVKIKKMKLNI